MSGTSAKRERASMQQSLGAGPVGRINRRRVDARDPRLRWSRTYPKGTVRSERSISLSPQTNEPDAMAFPSSLRQRGRLTFVKRAAKFAQPVSFFRDAHQTSLEVFAFRLTEPESACVMRRS